MAAKVFDLVGEKKVAARLTALAAKIPIQAGVALFAEAQIDATESRRRTPVDTGALRASHEVSKPKLIGDIEVTISVGGPAAPYALVVHEDLEAFHKVGRAKYLESVVMESAPFMAKRVASRLGIK